MRLYTRITTINVIFLHYHYKCYILALPLWMFYTSITAINAIIYSHSHYKCYYIRAFSLSMLFCFLIVIITACLTIRLLMLTYALNLYLLAIVIYMQCIIMLLNFILHSMRDESDTAATPPIKNKQCVAYTGVGICDAYYKQVRIYLVRILYWGGIYAVQIPPHDSQYA